MSIENENNFDIPSNYIAPLNNNIVNWEYNNSAQKIKTNNNSYINTIKSLHKKDNLKKF